MLGSSRKSAASTADLKRKSSDVGWDYAEICCADNRDKVKCRLCDKIMHGGITRLKKHIAGIRGQVSACPKSTLADKERCKNALDDVKKKKKEAQEELQKVSDATKIDEEKDVLEGSSNKSSRVLGPMDPFVSSIDLSASSSKESTQLRADNALSKKKALEVDACLARWIYTSGIPFNAININEWKQLVQAIGRFGPGYVTPSQHELRESKLKHELEKTNAFGNIMNLYVDFKLRTAFVFSKEGSFQGHTGECIFELVDEYIKKIGEENIVQVVTNNATKYMTAAKMLKAKRPNIFWTHCATHTIYLILEEIGNLPKFKEVVQKAKTLTKFIYAHHKILAFMRKFCEMLVIFRSEDTKFVDAFLTLQSLFKKRAKLMQMFLSQEWTKCKFSKTTTGKEVQATVCSHAFWDNVEQFVEVLDPLMRVLRLVDGDLKYSMGFVLGYLDEAKKKISTVCGDEGPWAKSILTIIESKSTNRLDTPLHLTSYMLNPIYFYRDLEEVENRCIDAFFTCVEALFPGQDENHCVITHDEFIKYKMKEGMFGKPLAIDAWESLTDAKFDPVGWWKIFGSQTPKLKKLAVMILSLSSSLSECERIHTKKYDRFDARLNEDEEEDDDENDEEDEDEEDDDAEEENESIPSDLDEDD